MPLDEATRRFAFLLQRDLRRMAERREEHASRGEEMKFDSVARVATVETHRGDSVGRLYGEVLATYSPYDRILRWAWAGRAPSDSITHGDVVFREGQARGVPQLAMSVVGDLDEADAATLVKLGALVARSEGVHDRKVGGEVQFIGLFDRPKPIEGGSQEGVPANRFSVPPPPVAERPEEEKAPPPRAYRSIPPIREIYEPRGSRPPPAMERSTPDPTSGRLAAPRPPSVRPPSGSFPPVVPRKVREPSRAIFLPVANAALAALTRASKGYLQGLFVVTVDSDPRVAEKRGFVVQLVVIDAAGILRALDPPVDVLEAAAAMIEADRSEGNGLWRKLSARITPKPDGGATLNVDVV